MTVYFKTISESEAFYSFKEGKFAVSGGGQSSYNLPKDFFKYMTNHNILIQDPELDYVRKSMDGNAYVLNDDYEFKLGPKLLSLIGAGYENVDNKFISSVNGTNGKFQVYRKVYDKMGWRYGWFVELYDKNLSGNELIMHIDEKNYIFTLDINFGQIPQSEFMEYLSQHPLRR